MSLQPNKKWDAVENLRFDRPSDGSPRPAWANTPNSFVGEIILSVADYEEARQAIIELAELKARIEFMGIDMSLDEDE